jgi:hypothetical protein
MDFVVFPTYEWEWLDRMDPGYSRIGEMYVIFHHLGEIYQNMSGPRFNGLLENLYKLFDASHAGKLVVFGAGLTAEWILGVFAFNVQYYLDNDGEKQKTGFRGKSVRNPVAYTKGDVILIAAMDEDGIKRQLTEIGVPNDAMVSGKEILFRWG